MKPRVLITNSVARDALEPIWDWTEITQGPSDGGLMPRPEALQLAPQLDAIINQAELRVDAELLDRAPKLKIVANVAQGFDNLDLAAMTRRGVWATNTPGAFTDAVAEVAVGLLLCLARKLTEADRFVRSGAWRSFQPNRWEGSLLRGKTLGIVGYGQSGQALARHAAALGMRVIFTRRAQSDDPAYRPLEQLLAESDFVSLHTPLNDDTQRLLDARRLRSMKKGARLINLARGKVVDETALVEALQSGHLAGAALDVFEDEPRVHPALLKMENVVLTPHLGGGTAETRQQARLLAARNVAAVLRGQKPLTPVNATLRGPALI